MKKTFLLLACAGALTLGSCSQDKSGDNASTTAATESGDASSTPASNVGYTDADYNTRANRIASDMATSMKLDAATRERVRTAYYNRSKRLGELHSKYTTDTTGMAAEMRSVYSDTDAEMKSIFTDPAQYSAYESSRSNYMEDRYMESDMADGSMSGDSSSMSGSSADMSASSDMGSTGGTTAGKTKIKGADGGKLKVKADGDIKTKDAVGNKGKVDADDGTIKVKPENGEKVKL